MQINQREKEIREWRNERERKREIKNGGQRK